MLVWVAVASCFVGAEPAAVPPPLPQNIPTLVELLSGDADSVAAKAAAALSDLGPLATAAIPALAKAAESDDEIVAREALSALRAIAPASPPALAAARKQIHSGNPMLASRAAEILADAGEAGVPIVVESLAPDQTGRYWAAVAAYELGPVAKDAVPALAKLLDDTNVALQREAMLALAVIGVPDAAAAEKMRSFLGKDILQAPAIYALTKWNDAPSLPKIQPLTEASDSLIRLAAKWSVARLSKEPANVDAALKDIHDALRAEDEHLRRAGVNALIDLGQAELLNPDKVAATIEGLSDEQLQPVIAGVAALGPSVLPRLIRGLGKPELRPVVLSILRSLEDKAAPAVPMLIPGLRSGDAVEREEIAYTLAAIGPPAVLALPELLRLLDDDSEDVQRAALLAIGRMGPAAKLAIPPLTLRLRGPENFGRLAAAWALARIAPDDRFLLRQVIPILVEGLKDERPFVRLKIAESLGDLGTEAASALPALLALESDSDPGVRQAGAAAAAKVTGR